MKSTKFKIQFDLLKKDLSHFLKKTLDQIFLETGIQLPTEQELYELLVMPPQREMGHMAFGCFTLAKLLKKAPPQIAQIISDHLQKDVEVKKISSPISAVGPYVNFFFTGEALGDKVIEPILKGDFFRQSLTHEAPRVMIEFSQPNTHKELHVGHMRNTCLGDALVRMFRYCSYPVISTTFPGDVGTHVAKCLWYLKFHNQEPIPNTDKGEWLGRIYSKAHLKLEDEVGTPKEEENKKQLTLILKQLEEKSGPYYDLWKETRQWSIDLMKDVYQWCDVHFDYWYWESEMDSPSVQFVKELYAQGKLIESQGAIGMDLSDQKLGFCVLLKSDGNGLYSTKDIELARRKFRDHHIEKSIYVVDTRQTLHFQQIFAVLDKLNFEEAKGCYHLPYNFVELPDGAMSSRKGNIVPLMHLVEQMQNHVKTQYLSRYESEWTSEELSKTAAIIAQGAIKYGMLKMDPNKKIVFDMNEWLKLEGDTGPYIQYAYSRIQSVLRKFTSPELEWIAHSNLITPSKNNSEPKLITNSPSKSISEYSSALVHPTELQLTVLISQLNGVILSATENYKPSVLCNYLYDVAKQFSQFYADCPIGYAENSTIKAARLALAHATGLVLKTGLAQLGIPVPARM